MLDRDVFLRPIAHRGYHDKARGRIENSPAAFRAAVEKGYAIECDLQPSADAVPMVFHDFTLERLTAAAGPVAACPASTLAALRLAGTDDTIPTLTDLLALTAGRVPLVIEIKSAWMPLEPAYLDRIAAEARAYRGPLALMSFDPAVMAAIRARAPEIPRGIVAGVYRDEGWWSDVLDAERRERLSHLLESADAAPAFYSYHVRDLPTPVTRYVREVQRLPLISWTVRTPDDRALAARWSDAPTFEGWEA
jgi:glycerophosphoryl diester phosphodiesterase